MMQPRVTKRERKLNLSYELPHRVHCAQIYPITAKNGSTVIIYGHDSGLRVLWRGGRRRKTQSPTPALPAPAVNGTDQSDIIVLDSDEEGQAKTKQPNPVEDDRYEVEEEDLDSDCPYPPIIEDLEISVGTDVLHIAVPALNASILALAPEILRDTALITFSSADGAIRVIQVPLEPPLVNEKDKYIAAISRDQIELSAGGPISVDLSTKLVNFAQQPGNLAESDSRDADGVLLVIAAATQSLKVWQVQLTDGEVMEPERNSFKSQHLPAPTTKISFHPSSRSALLLIADVSGSVRIYDPFGTQAQHGRPLSRESMVDISAKRSNAGSWVMTYHTSFHDAPEAPLLARRKKILDAKWIMTGKAILTLLEDGEWGIWEVAGPSQSGQKVEDFTFHGFLGSSSASSTSSTEANNNSKSRKGLTKLAPMTPNTRKAKSETLFAATPKVAGVASAGGISVSASSPRPGQADESVALWYNGDIYAITSMHAFWQRSSSSGGAGGGSSSSGGFGSLYAPGLAHVTDVNLMHERITSISQFSLKASPSSAAAAFGQMNTARDLLVAAERRLVFLHTLRPSTPSRALFQQAAAERPVSRGDQVMLDAGELDIGGMDRILDSMAAETAGDGRVRKVGFAH